MPTTGVFAKPVTHEDTGAPWPGRSAYGEGHGPGDSVERIPGYTGHEVQTKPGVSLSVPPPPPEPLLTIYPRVEGLRLVNERDANFSAPAATAVPVYSHAQLERMSKPGIQVRPCEEPLLASLATSEA